MDDVIKDVATIWMTSLKMSLLYMDDITKDVTTLDGITKDVATIWMMSLKMSPLHG